MLEKYYSGITLFSILTIIAVLFPPITWHNGSINMGSSFSFLFTIPNYNDTIIGGSINFIQLLVEIIFIFVVSLLFQLNYEKVKQWLKTKF